MNNKVHITYKIINKKNNIEWLALLGSPLVGIGGVFAPLEIWTKQQVYFARHIVLQQGANSLE